MRIIISYGNGTFMLKVVFKENGKSSTLATIDATAT